MKIAIIGGGISGCTAYLLLQKHLPKPPSGEVHSITIYEAYDTDKSTDHLKRGSGPTHSSTLAVGGGLGVGINGVNVLKRLDDALLRDVVSGGYVIGTMVMKAKSGTVLVRTSSNGKPVSSQAVGAELNMVASSRHSLWRCLRVRIPDGDIATKQVSQVVARADGRNIVTFVDGSQVLDVDLVLGADGLRSTVKQALFPEEHEEVFPSQYE